MDLAVLRKIYCVVKFYMSQLIILIVAALSPETFLKYRIYAHNGIIVPLQLFYIYMFSSETREVACKSRRAHRDKFPIVYSTVHLFVRQTLTSWHAEIGDIRVSWNITAYFPQYVYFLPFFLFCHMAVI